MPERTDDIATRLLAQGSRLQAWFAGLDPGGLGLGAYVNVVVHDDPEQARRLGEAGLSLFARFGAMHGTPTGPTSETERRVMQSIHDAYDMTTHNRSGSAQAADPRATVSD